TDQPAHHPGDGGLARPGFADQAQRGTRLDSERDSVDCFHARRPPERLRSDLETLDEVDNLQREAIAPVRDGGRVAVHDGFARHRYARTTSRRGWKHRVLCIPWVSSDGTSSRQRSVARSQRGAKGQLVSSPTTWIDDPGMGTNGPVSPIRGRDRKRAPV